ncbi:MAG: hypothetical protein LC667_11830 [Thioalkalivibrio sp.]|nr:hypothetical protein [Thioalkalivibrio sp.]
MSLTDDLSTDLDDDLPEVSTAPRPLVNPLAARRSLERLLEQRALRSRLHDDLDDSHALDELDW